MTAEESGEIHDKHRAKGIQYAVSMNLQHAQYLDQLWNPHENRQDNRRIGSKLHQLYSIKTNKRGLCAFDDKRILLDDNISTVPYGYYKINTDVHLVGESENENAITGDANEQRVDDNAFDLDEETDDQEDDLTLGTGLDID